jgi:hypothetical protein
MRPTARLLAVASILGAFLASGCKLIDQNTFAPAPASGPVLTPPATRVETRAPLLRVGPQATRAADEAVIGFAVRQAVARDPAVQFDVVATVPATGSFADQGKEAETLRPTAVQVMRSITAAGVDPARVHLGAQSSPEHSGAVILVYVR